MDCRFRLVDLLRRDMLCGLSLLAAIGIFTISGCITHPQNPSATQPATAIDPATTQPYYWLAKPAAAQVNARDFDAIWDVCKSVARDYQMKLERDDYRSGVITTAPLISKQWFEPWRPDTGTGKEVIANSLGAIRRSLRFEISRNADGGFTIVPKVLVEREVILERNVTDVSQYRFAFSGPATKIPPREAVTLEPETYPDIPIKYWYPTGRDSAMEVDAARRVRDALRKREALAGATGSKPIATASAAPPLAADGLITATGPDHTVFINLGVLEKVVPGMTFEVYGARATLPSLDGYAAVNPLSKGWIEVVSVGNGTSTCRIIKTIGPTPPKQDDQIFNFILGRGRANHFAVVGNFPDKNRERIVEVIQHWNGVVDARFGSATDYLILGSSPADGPAKSVYESIKSQAQQAKIPILNEERFNLLIRYYSVPAKR